MFFKVQEGYGRKKAAIPLFFISCCIFFLVSKAETAFCNYAEELVSRAGELHLSSERYWEVLVHYKSGLFGTKSLIDDPNFFLSDIGKKNPHAELEATLRSFFQEPLDQDNHPICKFPARYRWLKDKLGIDETLLPQLQCNKFEDTLSKVNPKSAVLVFPDAFMNSPASMFGHTLLRIDSDYESKLLSYAVNYAARTGETSGLTFAVKGIFGFYKGYFSILPYYEKVKEYSNMRDRDMWEYSLTFSEEEVERMFLHMWELEEIYSAYYFFDENCSYNLLFLLEAARPSLHLTDSFFYWVVPVDTIKAVIDSGVVGTKAFRPSISTRTKDKLSKMESMPQNIGLMRANNEISPHEILSLDIKKEEKIMAFDLATEIIQYRYANGDIPKEEYNLKYIENLKARSGLGKGVDNFYTVTPPIGPESGHGSGRLSLGAGSRDSVEFMEVQFRPAYHTLAEPDKGYLAGSQIVFGNVVARQYDGKGLGLERLDVIDILSISPRGKFFKPLSWKVITGVRKKTLLLKQRHSIYYVNPGAGYAYGNNSSGLFYIMGEVDLEAASEFEKGYSLGGGISAGLSKALTDKWKLNAYFKKTFYEAGDNHNSEKLIINNTYSMTTNTGLTLEYKNDKSFDYRADEFRLTFNAYY